LAAVLIRSVIAAAAALAFAAPAIGQAPLQTCFACHGPNGVSSLPLTPSLAAQPAFYVAAQLALFRAGKRSSDVMAPMAKTLSKDDLHTVAEAIEKLAAPPSAATELDSSKYQRGRAIVAREHCDSCHQPDFSGIENAPRLAHQREDYLVKALMDFRKGARIGYGEPVMPEVARALSEAEIADLAHYLSHFNSGPGS
jgi:cytochrome c553